MKKKKIFIVLGVIIVIILVGIGARIYWKQNYKELRISRWNDGKLYTYGIAKTRSEIPIDFREKNIAFRTESTKEELIEKNKDDYIGEVTYIDLPLKFQASLFYNDNNYFVLFNDHSTDLYWIQNCYLSYEMGDHCISIPSPVYLLLTEDILDEFQEDLGENVLDYYFDYYTYEQAKEFYERLSSEYVSFDDANQQITLAGKEAVGYEVTKDFLTIDFKERTMIGHEEEGDVVITGRKE